MHGAPLNGQGVPVAGVNISAAGYASGPAAIVMGQPGSTCTPLLTSDLAFQSLPSASMSPVVQARIPAQAAAALGVKNTGVLFAGSSPAEVAGAARAAAARASAAAAKAAAAAAEADAAAETTVRALEQLSRPGGSSSGKGEKHGKELLAAAAAAQKAAERAEAEVAQT